VPRAPREGPETRHESTEMNAREREWDHSHRRSDAARL